MTERQIDEYLKMYFPMLDMDMLCLIEDWNLPDHDIIGVGISITNMTRALQKCKNGRLWPFGWWHCMKALKFHKAECLDLMLIGILPEYQRIGTHQKRQCYLLWRVENRNAQKPHPQQNPRLYGQRNNLGIKDRAGRNTGVCW
jgi:hypothetical protein